MPTYTARLANRAEKQLLCWERQVKLDNQRGLTDINKAAENFYRGLLNIILDAELVNMNLMKMDFPAVDLAEKDGGICVQVTSSEGRDKVNHTLTEFFRNKLHKRYTRLILVIIGTKPKYNKMPFPSQDGFVLDRDADIWDTAGLIQQIEGLDDDKLKKVDEYLTRELGEMKEPVLHLPVPERRNPVGFLGRKAELAWLGDELKKGTKPVIVAGLGGVGKTALAVEFQKGWRGNVYFATFRDTFTRTLADSVGQAIPVQERQGLNEEQTAELALRYLSRCESGDLLIVDNAEVTGKKWRDLTKDPFYEKLRRLPMAVLMTTRHRDTGGRWLGRMAQEELREIFRRHEVQLSEGEMDALIDAVDGHTMTVDMIARTIRESWGVVSAEKILTAMKDNTLNEGDFDEIETDHDPEQRQIYAHLRALFDLSGIGDDGRQALRCATLLPQNGMDEALFRHALTEVAAKAIKLLEKKGWVDRKEGKVTIHPVVRLVCRTELKPTEENCEDFLFGIHNQYDEKKYDHVKFRQMAELFENAANMLEDKCGFWAGTAGMLWREVGEFVRTLQLSLRERDKLEKNLPDSKNLAAVYNNIGASYGNLGEYRKAMKYQVKALDIHNRVCPEDRRGLAACYNNVGSGYDNLGEHKEALEYKLKALEIGKEILPEDHPDLGIAYNNVGSTHMKLGNLKKAVEYHQKALEILERALPEDSPELARCYNNVGMDYGYLKKYKIALEYLQKSMQIRERVLPENHPDIAQSCNNMAYVWHQMKEPEKAVVYMRRATDIINQSSLPQDHPNRVNFNSSLKRLEQELEQTKRMEQALHQTMKGLGIDPFRVYKY